MGSTEAHSRLVNEILIAIGARSDCRAWKNSTGVARSITDDDAFIRYGLNGSGDIAGFKTGGRAFFIEVKTGAAKQSRQQQNFEAVCRRFGVAYAVCRSVDEAVSFLNGLQS